MASGVTPIQVLRESLLDLPVLSLSTDVADALKKGNVLLHAEPGAGKSTGLPLALMLDAELGGKIILLEPRRLAARLVAERLASHLGETVGERIGLRMRADTRVSDRTRLEVVTEGVLTRLLQNDPVLNGVALVIFDEFHERSLHADLGLALCLEVQFALRDDLRLLIMSATLESDAIRSGVHAVAEFHCDVRQHPVDTIFLGDSTHPLTARVVHAVLGALDDHTGDVLVFLPGVAEINRTARLLSTRLNDVSITVHPLHSGINSAAQTKATSPAVADCRRIILATSLAETSITIDGVRVVIDSGLERRSYIDSSTGAQRLETVTASQASAAQRAGRAGRTAPGVCFRLWSESGHVRRSAHWQPEVLRADLAPVIMELGTWGAADAQDLPWLTKPPAAALARACELLGQLGLWERGQLSARGRKVAKLPVHPRLGHMILWAAEQGVARIACQVAVRLEDQQRRHATVDLETMLAERMPAFLGRRADQLTRLVESLTGRQSSPAIPPPMSVLLAQAYPDWIARRRSGEAGRFLLACGAGAVLDENDELAHCQWLVVAQLGGAGSQARIFRAISLDVEQLENYSPELFTQVPYLGWDDQQQRVLAEHRLMVGSLLVNSRVMKTVCDADKAKGLIEGIRSQGLSCLPWSDECREWQARVQCMQDLLDENQIHDWPEVSNNSLMLQLDTWLLPFLQGAGSMKALQQVDLYKALKAMLTYQQQALLDEWLPRRYEAPSGSKISLSYVQPGNPVLSVRLQEMFGCSVNPAIAGGRLPLKVELLSPARRPVQITEDLANFWTNSYPAVKKDMAGRYPKHLWPEDPLSAKPTTRAKSRKS